MDFERPLKLVVLGNCQARPIAYTLSQLCSSVEVIHTPIIHLLGPEDEFEFFSALGNADYVVTQLIGDNYRVQFATTAHLERMYGSKIIKIVNLFFEGQTPGWVYLRDDSGEELLGPMGPYHNKHLMRAYLNGLTWKEAANHLQARDFDSLEAKSSLEELISREKGATVPISDFILQNFRKERLFHTFNHPTSRLIEEYAKRILIHLNLSIDGNLSLGDFEPLGKIAPSLPEGFLSGHSSKYAKNKALKTSIKVDGSVSNSGSIEYTNEEMTKAFWKVYDAAVNAEIRSRMLYYI